MNLSDRYHTTLDQLPGGFVHQWMHVLFTHLPTTLETFNTMFHHYLNSQETKLWYCGCVNGFTYQWWCLWSYSWWESLLVNLQFRHLNMHGFRRWIGPNLPIDVLVWDNVCFYHWVSPNNNGFWWEYFELHSLHILPFQILTMFVG